MVGEYIKSQEEDSTEDMEEPEKEDTMSTWPMLSFPLNPYLWKH